MTYNDFLQQAKQKEHTEEQKAELKNFINEQLKLYKHLRIGFDEMDKILEYILFQVQFNHVEDINSVVGLNHVRDEIDYINEGLDEDYEPLYTYDDLQHREDILLILSNDFAVVILEQ